MFLFCFLRRVPAKTVKTAKDLLLRRGTHRTTVEERLYTTKSYN